MHTACLHATMALAWAALVGCNMPFGQNTSLDQAHEDYLVAQGNVVIVQLARPELRLAADSLDLADEALSASADVADVNHLAYMARQRVAVARELASQRALDTTAAQRSATASLLVEEAQAHQRSLMRQLKALNAQQTPRGMVITMDDAMFDDDGASLQASGEKVIVRLAAILDQHPRRRAMIEGFTDSLGTRNQNQMRAGMRADAVKVALVQAGLDRSRANTHAVGEACPLASNGSAPGRRLNRRVEIILSDDSGFISPR